MISKKLFILYLLFFIFYKAKNKRKQEDEQINEAKNIKKENLDDSNATLKLQVINNNY